MPEPDHVTSAKTVYGRSAGRFVDAVGTTISPSFEAPFDRAMLDAFAETVGALPDPRVVDAGCGPGRATAHLAAHGLTVTGIDVAPGMVAQARRAHPHLAFEEAVLTELPVSDRSLAGVVYWYSIITTPPALLGPIWHELDRVLRPEGVALLAFQAGDNDVIVTPDAHGTTQTLTLHRHRPADVARSLESVGFEVHVSAERGVELPHETTPQAFLSVRRVR